MRGKPEQPGSGITSSRSIPACAGETGGMVVFDIQVTVYPRVCGGNRLFDPHLPGAKGLSPRVRGKPAGTLELSLGRRSIPACAGETPTLSASPYPSTVYPRVCGGNWGRRCRRRRGAGLSPRVRGKQTAYDGPQEGDGSIPACAGETPTAAGVAGLREVYPRVCGGNHRPQTYCR